MAEEVSGELTFAELQKIRSDNVGYEFDASLAKARAYIEATDAMLTFALRETEHGGDRVSIEPTILERQLERARRWYSIRSLRSVPLPVFQPAPGWREE